MWFHGVESAIQHNTTQRNNGIFYKQNIRNKIENGSKCFACACATHFAQSPVFEIEHPFHCHITDLIFIVTSLTASEKFAIMAICYNGHHHVHYTTINRFDINIVFALPEGKECPEAR